MGEYIKEIGGYLELERFEGEQFHKGAIALNSGRGCLAYLTELRDIKTVWLPDFICDSVPALFEREGVAVKSFSIGDDFLPVYDFEVAEDEWMLLVDYYGQLCAADVERAYDFSDGKLIVDESQGFYRLPWDGADTTYTCRKWFGVSDGGYLYTGDGARLKRCLSQDESFKRMGYLLGRFERTGSEFFADAQANNEVFATEPVKKISLLTANIMSGIDYGSVRKHRNENWQILHGAFASVNELPHRLRKPECAFMYPLLASDGPAVRRKLAEQRVYVPTLWPNCVEELDENAVSYRLARNVLPLPVDQRYGTEDMNRVIELIKGVMS